MKSLTCDLDGSMATVEVALAEAEGFANQRALTVKQGLHLRLLAEELLGMASSLIWLRDGRFWVEEEDGHYELHLTAEACVDANVQKQLVGASTTGKNEMHKGITGKIRQATEWLLSPYSDGVNAPAGFYDDMSFTSNLLYQEWSLLCYRESIHPEEAGQPWDELEKSVLGKLADDIRVGVKSGRVEITIHKTF